MHKVILIFKNKIQPAYCDQKFEIKKLINVLHNIIKMLH